MIKLQQKLSKVVEKQWLIFCIKYLTPHGQRKKTPEDCSKMIVSPILKKGDKFARENYRAISLLSIPGKVFANPVGKDESESRNQVSRKSVWL